MNIGLCLQHIEILSVVSEIPLIGDYHHRASSNAMSRLLRHNSSLKKYSSESLPCELRLGALESAPKNEAIFKVGYSQQYNDAISAFVSTNSQL